MGGSAMKILLIEDDDRTASFIIKGLKQAGYTVNHASDGEDGLHFAETQEHDLAIVDIMLPKLDGLSLISRLRQKKITTPVIVLSAKNSVDDRIKGLQSGGDDYLVKPFAFSELLARIQSLIRRKNFDGKNILNYHEIKININAKAVFIKNNAITLTAKEYELLLFFIANKNKVVTKNAIAEHLWGDDMDQSDSFDFIYTHIKNLRKKMIDKGGEDYIKTIYGIGYNFSAS